jgi:hypothetical protein
MTATELAASQPSANKESKVFLAIANQVFNTITSPGFRALGFSATKSAPSGVAPDIFRQSFAFTWQKLLNLDTDSLSAIPVPTTGANANLGKFSVLDLFPGASKLAAAAAVPGAGIVVQTSGLSSFSSLTHANLNISASSDNRDWLAALLDYFAVSVSVRSATTASGVVAATASPLGGVAIPANFFAATDPLSGLLSTEVPKSGLITRTLNYTIELQLNQVDQVFDVRVATN